jgi:hypothetical protein
LNHLDLLNNILLLFKKSFDTVNIISSIQWFSEFKSVTLEKELGLVSLLMSDINPYADSTAKGTVVTSKMRILIMWRTLEMLITIIMQSGQLNQYLIKLNEYCVWES